MCRHSAFKGFVVQFADTAVLRCEVIGIVAAFTKFISVFFAFAVFQVPLAGITVLIYAGIGLDTL